VDKKRRAIWNIVFYSFIALFAVLAILLIAILDGCFETAPTYNNGNNTSSGISEDELVENPIDFAHWRSINSDIYAWIRVPNTNIDYPVAQSSTDDIFYLHHDIYGKYKFSGTIYTEMQNSREFTDPNTVLYGHNMTKGYMFHNLYKFQDETFFNNNKYFYIYTPTNVYTYTIYSAYQYDDRHILNSFDFTDKEIFANYIEMTKNPTYMLKNVREDVSVTTDDKIVTLSTCLGNGRLYRYLVQGVLTNVQKTKWTI